MKRVGTVTLKHSKLLMHTIIIAPFIFYLESNCSCILRVIVLTFTAFHPVAFVFQAINCNKYVKSTCDYFLAFSFCLSLCVIS